jgi:hypothetical protein
LGKGDSDNRRGGLVGVAANRIEGFWQFKTAVALSLCTISRYQSDLENELTTGELLSL